MSTPITRPRQRLKNHPLFASTTKSPTRMRKMPTKSLQRTKKPIFKFNKRQFAALAPSQGDIVGIDLGTTNSCVAIIEGKLARILENSEGVRITPSIVSISKEGDILVGSPARRQLIHNPLSAYNSIKRIIGRRYNDPVVQHQKNLVSYKIIEAPNGDAWVEGLAGKKYSPSQIASYILMKMKTNSEDYLGRQVKDCIICVPAHFNDAQRQATKDAGVIAGFTVKRILNEPTAAALCYGHDRQEGQIVVVYDLGGGTFDVSIMSIYNGVFAVKALNGNAYLGGDDFDLLLIQHVLADFKKQTSIDLTPDLPAMARVREACERAKIELTHSLETDIYLPFLTADASGPKHLQYKISRAQHDKMCEPLLQQTVEPSKSAMAEARVSKKVVSEVVLVGGMTRWPLVTPFVKKIFGGTPMKEINPDEAVAYGAALHAAVLKGKVSDVLLLDVTPLSLGVETFGGVFTKLINRNTTIPTKKSQIFSTAADMQTVVTIKVYQGERSICDDNKLLGEFQLHGIPPMPRGQAQVLVTFDIDASGIVTVKAEDKASMIARQVVLASNRGLSKDDIEKLVGDAEIAMAADREKERYIIQSNKATHLATDVAIELDEHRHKLQPKFVERISNALTELRDIIDDENNKASIEELEMRIAALTKGREKMKQLILQESSGQLGTWKDRKRWDME